MRITDLEAAGLYDPASVSRPGWADGLRQRTENPCAPTFPFIGMEAIPSGINPYGSLYHAPTGKLLDEPRLQGSPPEVSGWDQHTIEGLERKNDGHTGYP